MGAASLATMIASHASAANAQDTTQSAWNAGDVAHLLPTVDHQRFLIKVSFTRPHQSPPALLVDRRKVPGRPGDTRGLFWTFDATELEPGRRYELQILDARGRAVCDPWPLATFPSPSDSPARLRLLIYSCAGGHDVLPATSRPMSASTVFYPCRAETLLARACRSLPDAVVANGDQSTGTCAPSARSPR